MNPYPQPIDPILHGMSQFIDYLQKPALKGKCTVYELDFEITTDHIDVTLEVTDGQGDDDTQTIRIDHKGFLNWLEEKDYLTMTGGGHAVIGGDYEDSTYTFTIGYAEYLQDYITKADIKQYLIEKKIVSHEWDSAAV